MVLRNGLLSLCEGSRNMDDHLYQLLRRELMNDPALADYVPRFVKQAHDTGAMWAFFRDHADKWAPRRQLVRDEFALLIDFLERAPGPADTLISDTISSFDAEGVKAAWDKALTRRETDPSGAITAARTLLESVCKHLLDDAGKTASYGPHDDLPKLYRLTSEHLRLVPAQQTEEALRRVLSGAANVMEGLCTLRNKAGDAHAGGRSSVAVEARHAALAVNMAGSMALFLIETASAQVAQKTSA